ncbi:bifunctional demethylmenaquinone methyltransferase/2-methoxy-6-polyprenyl-1,4-benzoquinol methylase UbiE [Campylobacter sp. 19-13652]|uniref:bifunctional demethylmenaquinone methyltransferase/2-methoxy-6-polyprenyl-1,4-benzoquinol methylase UbiE n=1 Tax=Campylobacter sp. 19-13652 TaxID=2840180 RepID=UPI001C75D959|nr:bifunctional demethylmenaquinone methyltransferase/2-methoxy-6-polyprenyl-1,4-benzoquinol methylase UbiE [Campylobacter sp. 19-13652]BCX78825.1 ubiquinone/menaquinone biosynthesis C-methyltransferase UbiE [Campylobacter sp. 19-13652]
MQKQEKIVKMFDAIAPTYDVANRVLSLGIDIKWRREACEFALSEYAKDDISIVDVACGTGDMMKIWQDTAKKQGVNINSLIGVDPSNGMLAKAREKFSDFNFKFIEAYADNTTLKSASADILSISYGIRNVIERKEALKEFNRVLKNDGLVVVLEFTRRSKEGFISRLRDFYLQKILPKIGGFISKNKEAYEYLPNSIEGFLDAQTFCDELRIYGFEIVFCKSFSADISTLFVAKKIRNC